MVYNATGHFDVSELTCGLGAQFLEVGKVRNPEAETGGAAAHQQLQRPG